LTIESEERETWTAKSLRGAHLRAGEDFGGHVYQVHRVSGREAGEQRCAWDSSNDASGNRCGCQTSDQPASILIQLESLILAQNERWRQA
jgi:hypothetical protein